MEFKNQGWLIFKTDRGWELKTVSTTSDLKTALEGTYWLMPIEMPRFKSHKVGWLYAFHQLPSPVLTWAILLQAKTLPINHHDPNDKQSTYQSYPDTSSNH